MKTLKAMIVLLAFSIVTLSCNEDDLKSEQKISEKIIKIDDNSFAREGTPTIKAFLSSETYLRHKDYIDAKGQMNIDNVQYKEVNVNEEIYDLFIIPILDDNVIVGKLEVLDLKGTNYLPNNDKFALNYADLSDYDLNMDTGSIKLYDLNFDNFLHSQISVNNGIFVSYNSTGLSQELKDKYSSVANRTAPKNVSCDPNHNGDVTWSECYRCISVAVQLNPTSTAICESYHASGLPWWGSCEMSAAAACIVISALN